MSKILIDLTTARQVLEALNSFPPRHLTPFISDTRTALREALAEPQPEPVAWMSAKRDMTYLYGPYNADDIPLYTSPPAQEFVCSTGLCHYRKPQQEPVAWVCYGAPGKRDIDFEEADINGLPIGTLLYTSPPARKPLTDEQVLDCWKQAYDPGRREHDNATRMARTIEAKHNIKGDA